MAPSDTAGRVTPPDPADLPPDPGSGLAVYLLTMGPGEAVWERFGHNAIWIRDHRTGTDRVYNWGIFDFSQADFVPRLARGRMLYWMAVRPLDRELAAYAAAGRGVWAQELALTHAQRARLRDFVEWNARPENRFYRYDYYRDNCSTRVRDALDRALGGVLHGEMADEPTETTWRWHTRRALRGVLPAYLGVQTVLGHPADREITAWEEAFLPEQLRLHLREVVVPGPEGRTVPLVSREWRVLPAQGESMPERPRSLFAPLLGLSLIAAVGILFLGRAARRGALWARAALATVGGGWSLLAGVGGTLLVSAWLFTDHDFWQRNENLLQASPLSLLLVVLLPLLFLGRTGGGRTRVLAAAVAALSLLGLLVQLLPGFDQVNGEILALALPLHLALAWAAWEVADRRAPGAGGLRARRG